MRRRGLAAILVMFLFGVAARAGEIHNAASSGDLETVEALLKKAPKLVNEKDDSGNSPLSYAAGSGQQAVAELLIQKGADVNARGQDGSTALIVAAFAGHKDICEMLLAKGADINVQDKEGHTALWRAVQTDHVEMIKLLVEKGADPNLGFKPREIPTPLHKALTQNDPGLVKLLLEKGADLNARNESDLTPLHQAAANLQLAMVKLLLEKGADVNARAGNEFTPLDVVGADLLVARNELDDEEDSARKEIIALLRKKGAKDDPAKRSRFLSLGRQGEVKTLLMSLVTMQEACRGETDKYGTTFEALYWSAQGDTRYAYFVADDVIQPSLGEPCQLPKGIKAEITAAGFTMVGVGNIDDDDTLDVWTVNEKKELKNISNDAEK